MTKDGRTPGGVQYRVQGSGPAVLWLSGYVVPVAAFRRVLRSLADDFTVVSPDHRGSGRSRARVGPTSTRVMAFDALQVLDELRIDAAHVVGVSLGGMVAQELALAAPHRVLSLSLVSTSAGGLRAEAPPAPTLVTELASSGEQVEARVPIRLSGVLSQGWAASTHDTSARLGQVRPPTLVLHGDQDVLVPVANAAWVARQVEGARLQVVRGAGHLLLLESESARSLLRSWLDEQRDAGPAAAPPSSVQRVRGAAAASYRLVCSQTLPTRRLIRAGSRLVRPVPRSPGPGIPSTGPTTDRGDTGGEGRVKPT